MSPRNVVLDTDPRRAELRGLPVTTWLDALDGDRVLISFQTRAEVIAGLRAGSWGDSRRQTARAKLDAVPTIPADSEVIDSYAELTWLCLRAGHALPDKVHTADRWVAACAVAKELPLLSGDGIYQGAPGLSLLMEG